MALIKTKEQNLVYFNFPEKDDGSIAEKMKHDFKLLSKAYNKEIDPKEITNMFRVGKKSGKDRPLIVKYGSMDIKNSYLKSSGYLKIKHEDEIKSVYVSIDRTQKQREKHRKLVEELKTKKQEPGNESLVIRGEKIVQNFQIETGLQRTTWPSLFQR